MFTTTNVRVTRGWWPVVMAAVLGCAACAPAEQSPEAVQGASAAQGVLRVGQTGEPDSLDPHVAVSGPAIVVVNDLFEGLMTLDAEGRTVHGAAEGHELSADQLTYTFTLRPNLRWSDGHALTAEDFVYSFRRIANPRSAATALAVNVDLIRNGAAIFRGRMEPEALGVTALDEHTVRIELEHPAPHFLSIISMAAFAPVPRHVIEQHGRSWTRPGVMVSNGPFVLAAWQPNDFLRIEKNPLFHAAETVQLDAVVYRAVIDLNSGLRQFQAGALDTLTNFPPEKIELLRDKMPGAARFSPSLGLVAYLINHRLPKFQDPRVRAALSLAIDRQIVTERVVRSGDQPAYGLVPSGIPGYFPAIEPPALTTQAARIAAARQLLAAAGYSAERPLEVELMYHNSEEHKKVAIAAAAMWRAIGVKTVLRSADRQVVDASARNGQFEIVRLALFAGFVDPSGFFNAVRVGSPVNGSGYASQRLEQFLDQAAAAADAAQRAQLLRDAERVAVEDHALIPLYFLMSRRLVARRVQGWPEKNLTALRPSRYLSVESIP